MRSSVSVCEWMSNRRRQKIDNCNESSGQLNFFILRLQFVFSVIFFSKYAPPVVSDQSGGSGWENIEIVTVERFLCFTIMIC